MKILIAVPTFDDRIYPETYESIHNLIMPERATYSFKCVKGYDVARARNEIAKMALKGNFDYVLMVDSDMVLPSYTLQMMLRDPKEVSLALYPGKRAPEGYAEVYRIGQSDFKDRVPYEEFDILSRIKVKGGGMGCALIHVPVFEKLNYPYFKYVVYANGSVLSEDLYFCNQVNEKGIDVYADGGVKCGHIMKQIKY